MRRNHPEFEPSVKQVRSAIYSRLGTKEGLERVFNSHDGSARDPRSARLAPRCVTPPVWPFLDAVVVKGLSFFMQPLGEPKGHS